MDYLTALGEEAKDLLAHSKVWRTTREELGADVHAGYLEALIASFTDMEKTWTSVINRQLEANQKAQQKLNDDRKALRKDEEALHNAQEALRNDQGKCRGDREDISKRERIVAQREQLTLNGGVELEAAQKSFRSGEDILKGLSLSSRKEEDELQQSRQEVKRLGDDLQSSKERVNWLLGNVATYKQMHSEELAKADGLQMELDTAKAELQTAQMKIRQFEDDAEEQSSGKPRGNSIVNCTGSRGDVEGAAKLQSMIPLMTPATNVSFKRPLSNMTPGTPSRPRKKTKPTGSEDDTREWNKAWTDFVGVVNSLRPSCDEYVEGADVRALLREMVCGILAGPDRLASLVDSDLRDEWYCYAEVYEMGPLAWNAIVIKDVGCARHQGKPCWQIQITVGADMVKRNRWRFSSGSRE